MRSLDWVKVKGKNDAVEIFEVMMDYNEQSAYIDDYNDALNDFRNEKLSSALEKFKDLNEKINSKVYQLYITRCEYYIQNPDIEFNAVETMTTK